MPLHSRPCDIAGTTVKVKENNPLLGGRVMFVEDWFDRVFGTTWRAAHGCVPAKEYGERLAQCYPNDAQLALSDAVVVGNVDGYQMAVHVSELALPESKIETLYAKRSTAY